MTSRSQLAAVHYSPASFVFIVACTSMSLV